MFEYEKTTHENPTVIDESKSPGKDATDYLPGFYPDLHELDIVKLFLRYA